jgi:hypothetical protein
MSSNFQPADFFSFFFPAPETAMESYFRSPKIILRSVFVPATRQFSHHQLLFLDTFMPVSQHESAQSRGRLPSYLHHQADHLLSLLLEQRAQRGRMATRISLMTPQLMHSLLMRHHHRSSNLL